MGPITNVSFINVTPENVAETGVYCIKSKKDPGYAAKVNWFKNKLNEGLKMIIAEDEKGKQLGFIEFLPAEKAWRPIQAGNQLFIHCIGMFGKAARNQGIGNRLIKMCEEEAKASGKEGICTLSSKGAWMADKSIFEKNGFVPVEEKERFELMFKPLKEKASTPHFYDWTPQLKHYQGWHLVYSDQCPWHDKAVQALTEAAEGFGIQLQIKKLNSPDEAQKAPSGFGTFSLIRDGRLLEDHYISKTRFVNILEKELKDIAK